MSLTLGYALSSEEHVPADLVRHARLAEERGFEFALISDHFHPWTDRQGQSPFVWSVLGAISQVTGRLQIGTGVTCPTVRIHPAIIAQAAATTAALLPGRFFLGVGTGEALNEHIVGETWPEWEVRAEMLEEAIDVIRRLWSGAQVSHRGRHFTVANARLYTLPDAPPPIYVAAGGSEMAEMAVKVGDGLIGTAPDVVTDYRKAGGKGPAVGQVSVCWARSAAEARRVAHEWWPTAAVRGEASQELPLPRHFEQLVQDITADDVAKVVVCGPDPEPMLDKIRSYEKAGYDHVYLHQVGPDQDGFLEFAARELLPVATRQPALAGAGGGNGRVKGGRSR